MPIFLVFQALFLFAQIACIIWEYRGDKYNEYYPEWVEDYAMWGFIPNIICMFLFFATKAA